jgi:uncharacterized surface protein with fasciclin (FAS1) repeats
VNHRPTRLLTAMLASAGLLVATACSEDPNSSSTTPTEAPAATTESSGTEAGTDTTVSPDSPDTTIDRTPIDQPIGDLVGTALTNHVFTTLAGYVLEAGLVDTLRSPGPFTVFAPPDPAFQAIPVDTLRSVQADIPLLTTVLTYHVVPGLYMAADLVPGEYETAAGIPLTVTVEGDTVLVNGAEVILADVPATNGVIHVIDSVLLPPEG